MRAHTSYAARRAGPLTPAERRALDAVCAALLPGLEAGPGRDPVVFGANAARLRVPRRVEALLEGVGRDRRIAFRRGLRLIERPWVMLLLVGRHAPLSGLPLAERERALLAMATSRVPSFRAAFQAFKRLACFAFYAAEDDAAGIRLQRAIGYVPPPPAPAAAPALELTRVSSPASLECDACVIGSGAGGSVIAARLAGAGLRVVVLEAGPGLQPPDYPQRELAGFQQMFLDGGLTATRDLGMLLLAGGVLGGGTTVNWQTSLPPPAAVLEAWAARTGCADLAGPGMATACRSVAERLNVSSAANVVNGNNDALRRGCEALGLTWSAIPRNARDCDPGLCGFCMFGCQSGAKQSAAVTYLLDAQRDGTTSIVTDCTAETLLVAGDRVAGVRAAARDPSSGLRYPLEVRAPLVVVAAGALRSPALLLRSGLRLAALGRNLFLHPTAGVGGVYDEAVEAWSGMPQTVLCEAFADAGAPAFRIEAVPAHPGLMAVALPWLGALDHRTRMAEVARTAAFMVLVRDEEPGRVRPGGDGRPIIDYRPGRRERDALQRGMVEAVRLHFAAGAREVLTLHARPLGLARKDAGEGAIRAFCQRLARAPVHANRCTLFSAHQMGTCAMGAGPDTGVCDADGQVFGVRGLFIGDASAFPTATGVNPMLSVMALAHRTAERILDQLTSSPAATSRR